MLTVATKAFWILILSLNFNPETLKYEEYEFPKYFDNRGDCLLQLQDLAKNRLLDARQGKCKEINIYKEEVNEIQT